MRAVGGSEQLMRVTVKGLGVAGEGDHEQCLGRKNVNHTYSRFTLPVSEEE